MRSGTARCGAVRLIVIPVFVGLDHVRYYRHVRDHGVVHFGTYPFRYQKDHDVAFGTTTRSPSVSLMNHFSTNSFKIDKVD